MLKICVLDAKTLGDDVDLTVFDKFGLYRFMLKQSRRKWLKGLRMSMSLLPTKLC